MLKKPFHSPQQGIEAILGRADVGADQQRYRDSEHNIRQDRSGTAMEGANDAGTGVRERQSVAHSQTDGGRSSVH